MVNHLYDNNSRVYNFLFHPLHEKAKEIRAVSIITTIFLTVVTGGLWQIPFWIINRTDHQKLKKANAQRLSNPVTVSTITVSRRCISVAERVGSSPVDKSIKSKAEKRPKDKKDNLNQPVPNRLNISQVEVPLQKEEKHPVTKVIDKFGTPCVVIDLTEHLKLGNTGLLS